MAQRRITNWRPEKKFTIKGTLWARGSSDIFGPANELGYRDLLLPHGVTCGTVYSSTLGSGYQNVTISAYSVGDYYGKEITSVYVTPPAPESLTGQPRSWINHGAIVWQIGLQSTTLNFAVPGINESITNPPTGWGGGPSIQEYSWTGDKSVDFEISLCGPSDLVVDFDGGAQPAIPWNPALGGGGGLDMFGARTASMYDEMHDCHLYVKIGDQEAIQAVTGTFDKNEIGVTLAAMAPREAYMQDGVLIPYQGAGVKDGCYNTYSEEDYWAKATISTNFRDNPIGTRRRTEYDPRGLTVGWGCNALAGDTVYFHRGSEIKDGTLKIWGGWANGSPDGGVGQDNTYVTRVNMDQHSGSYTVDYTHKIMNMFTSVERTDLSIVGQERHPREELEHIQITGSDVYNQDYYVAHYFYDNWDVYGNYTPTDWTEYSTWEYGAIVRYGGKLHKCKKQHYGAWDPAMWVTCGEPVESKYIDVGHGGQSITYKGSWSSYDLGEFLDLPLNSGWDVWHGGMSIIGMESTFKDTATDLYDPASWTEKHEGEPSHPGWQPMPTQMFYWDPDHRMYFDYGNPHSHQNWWDEEYVGADDPQSTPWYDTTCPLALNWLTMSNAITFTLAQPDVRDVVATPVVFNALPGSWNTSKITATQDSTWTILTTGADAGGAYAKKDIFASNIRLTGSRFARVNWTADKVTDLVIKIGDDTHYAKWTVSPPAGWAPNTSIESIIDLCSPDECTIEDPANPMQSICEYEEPLDQSQSVPGLAGVRRSDESSYNYLLPKGWGVGKIRQIRLEVITPVTVCKVKNIELIWKKAEDGGFQKLYVFPFQHWVDDRSETDFSLAPSGYTRVTSSEGGGYHDNYHYTYSKAVLIVDGAVVLEIPMGHLTLDLQDHTDPDWGESYPSPCYVMTPYKASSSQSPGVTAYPLDNYANPTGYRVNGVVSSRVNDSTWDDWQKDNAYIGYMVPGIYTPDANRRISVSLRAMCDTITMRRGMFGSSAGISGVYHTCRGGMFGLDTSNAGQTITIANPDASPGHAETRTVNVSEIGWWECFGLNTKAPAVVGGGYSSGNDLRFNHSSNHLIYCDKPGPNANHLVYRILKQGTAIPMTNRYCTRTIL